MTPFIVAEVSTNYSHGKLDCPELGHLCQRFEQVIEVNRRRGYRLHSWKLDRIMPTTGELNETIIAVFQRAEDGQPTMEGTNPAPGEEEAP